MSEPNVLPQGWARTTVADIAESINYGHTASASDDTDGPRFLRITDIQDGHVAWSTVPSCNITADETSKYRLKYGDIVFARTGATTGKSYLIRDCPEAVFASYLIRLRMHRGIDPAYIQLYFQTSNYWRQIEGGKRGIGQPNVNASVLGTIRLPVAPEKEQRRVVAIVEELFSELDVGVAALERARVKLKRYRAAVLKAAVEGKLTEAWRAEHPNTEPASKLLERILTERRQKWEADQLAKFAAFKKQPPKKWKSKYAEPSRPDVAGLPKLPNSWCWASVEQCASGEPYSIADGPFGSNLKTEHYTDAGPRVIRLKNVGDGVFVDHDAHISEQHYAKLGRHSAESGDVVTAMLGETLPRACVVPSHIPPAIVKADCVRIRPDRAIVFASYLVYALNAQPTRERASTKIAGVGRPRLNLEKLRPLAIQMPPVSEQASIISEISEIVSQIEAAETEIERGLLRAARLRQSILKQAFEGKLVPQDPVDEPAGLLLGRICAQQAEHESNKSRNRSDSARPKAASKRRIKRNN